MKSFGIDITYGKSFKQIIYNELTDPMIINNSSAVMKKMAAEKLLKLTVNGRKFQASLWRT